MKLVLLPSIYYEVVTESACLKVVSRFFTHPNFLRCRELALTYFLERLMSDDLETEEFFLTLYMRHKSGERVEIINSATYGQAESCLEGLKRELELFQQERIKTAVAVYNSKYPKFISILSAQYQNHDQLRKEGHILTLADDYSVFFRNRKERFLIA